MYIASVFKNRYLRGGPGLALGGDEPLGDWNTGASLASSIVAWRFSYLAGIKVLALNKIDHERDRY